MNKRKLYIYGLLLTGTVFVCLTLTHFYPLTSQKQPILPTIPTTAVAPTVPDVYGLWQDTNNERVKAGLAPLVLDERLNQSAQAKCNDMVANGWGHIDPQGRHGYHFIQEIIPGAKKYGENLAEEYNTDTDITSAWMNSPAHKAAILDPIYTDVGFGVCSAKGVEYTVQHFVGL